MHKATLLSASLLLLVACENKAPEPVKDSPTQSGQKPGATQPAGATPTGAAAKTYEHAGMLDPSKANEKAPDTFKAKFSTTQGDFTMEVTRAWSPNGADRLYNLVKIGYFADVAFFRVVDGFMAQFGIHGDPQVAKKWMKANIDDDQPEGDNKQTNARGMVTFAKSGSPNSRSTQLFISFKDNSFLDGQGFTPVGKIVEGMETVDKLYNGYGEDTTAKQGMIVMKGNGFLKESYPKLDYIKSASIVP